MLLTRQHRAYLVEIKDREWRNRFTDMQVEYYSEVQCLVFVIRTIDDVEAFVNGQIQAINGWDTLTPKK